MHCLHVDAIFFQLTEDASNSLYLRNPGCRAKPIWFHFYDERVPVAIENTVRNNPPDSGVLIFMNSSAQYRRFADECFRLAKQAKDEHQQTIFKEFAEAWLNLAQESDQKGRQQAGQAKRASSKRRAG